MSEPVLDLAAEWDANVEHKAITLDADWNVAPSNGQALLDCAISGSGSKFSVANDGTITAKGDDLSTFAGLDNYVSDQALIDLSANNTLTGTKIPAGPFGNQFGNFSPNQVMTTPSAKMAITYVKLGDDGFPAFPLSYNSDGLQRTIFVFANTSDPAKAQINLPTGAGWAYWFNQEILIHVVGNSTTSKCQVYYASGIDYPPLGVVTTIELGYRETLLLQNLATIRVK